MRLALLLSVRIQVAHCFYDLLVHPILCHAVMIICDSICFCFPGATFSLVFVSFLLGSYCGAAE